MKVKDCMILAAALLGREDVAAYLADGTEADGAEREAKLLLRCFNIVESELALDYAPLLCTEVLESDTGAVFYSMLRKEPVSIRSVEDLSGNERKFLLYPEYLKTDGGRLKITYSYLPEKKTSEDESDYTLQIGERLVAFGMAAEYRLAEGDYESAAMWDKRYRAALKNALAGNGVKGCMRAKKWA